MAGIATRRQVYPRPQLTTKPGAHRNDPYFDEPWAAPPPGTFGPGIGYEVGKSRRGLEQLLEDERKELERARNNTKQGKREIERGRRRSVADTRRDRGYAEIDTGHELEDLGLGHQRKVGALGINFARDIQDLSTARLRGNEDYERTLTDMQHRYGSAAEQQAQAAIQQGTNEAGTEAASAAVRGANQAYDKSGVDLSNSRRVSDLDLREGRTREDYARRLGEEDTDFGTNQGRIGEGLARKMVAYGLNESRSNQDARTARRRKAHELAQGEEASDKKTSRAKGEQAEYERAQTEAAYYEAHQLHPKIKFPGAVPPEAPKPVGPSVLGGVPLGKGPGSKTNVGAGGTYAPMLFHPGKTVRRPRYY